MDVISTFYATDREAFASIHGVFGSLLRLIDFRGSAHVRED